MSKELYMASVLSVAFHVVVLAVCPRTVSNQYAGEGKVQDIVVCGVLRICPVPVDAVEPVLRDEPLVSKEVIDFDPVEESGEMPVVSEPDIDEQAEPETEDQLRDPVLAQESLEEEVGEEEMTAGQEADVRTQYLMSVARKLQQEKKYPVLAFRRGIEGVVHLGFTIMADGTVCFVDVSGAERKSVLYKEVVDLAERVSPLDPIPEGLALSKMRLSVPIVFKIEDRF